MSCGTTLYLNEPSQLDLEFYQGQSWIGFRSTRMVDGEAFNLTGYTGKMRILNVDTGLLLAITPTFVAVDLANGQWGFDMTIADTDALPYGATLKYDMFLTSGATISIPVFYGAVIVHENVTPIP